MSDRVCDNCEWWYDAHDGNGEDCQHPLGPSSYCCRWTKRKGADE